MDGICTATELSAIKHHILSWAVGNWPPGYIVLCQDKLVAGSLGGHSETV